MCKKVVLGGWKFYNEKLEESDIRRAYFGWLEAIKLGVTYYPTVPVGLKGTCVNHPNEEEIDRGIAVIGTSSIKSIASVDDKDELQELGFAPQSIVFVADTISESPIRYYIDLSQADCSQS